MNSSAKNTNYVLVETFDTDKLLESSPSLLILKIDQLARLISLSHTNHIFNIKADTTKLVLHVRTPHEFLKTVTPNRNSIIASLLKRLQDASLALALHARTPHEFSLTVTPNRNSTIASQLKRLQNASWWRKKIYTLFLKRREHLAFINKELGFDKPDKCCSAYTVELMHLKKLKNDAYLEQQKKIYLPSIKSGTPITFNLKEANKSASKNKFHEVFLTIKSLERIADNSNFEWAFVTFTCPSKFHSNPKNKTRNEIADYDNDLTFKNGSDYLNGSMFKTFQKRLDKKFKRGKDYFGFKVIEVHDDGCPHMHFLIFFDSAMKNSIESVIEKLYNADRPEWYFRTFKDKLIKYGLNRSSVGSDLQGAVKCAAASSYIFNYLAFAMQYEDSDNKDINYEMANRYKCAIRAAGTRQYSFFGVKSSLTKRRALRKVKRLEISPQNLHAKRLADQLYVSKTDPLRLEKQLEASVAFITADSQNIDFVKEVTKNKFGEEVVKIVGIKHRDDAEHVQTSGLCMALSKNEFKLLTHENEGVQRLASLYISSKSKHFKMGAISVNYSSKSKEQEQELPQSRLRPLEPDHSPPQGLHSAPQTLNALSLPLPQRMGMSEALKSLQERRGIYYKRASTPTDIEVEQDNEELKKPGIVMLERLGLNDVKKAA